MAYPRNNSRSGRRRVPAMAAGALVVSLGIGSFGFVGWYVFGKIFGEGDASADATGQVDGAGLSSVSLVPAPLATSDYSRDLAGTPSSRGQHPGQSAADHAAALPKGHAVAADQVGARATENAAGSTTASPRQPTSWAGDEDLRAFIRSELQAITARQQAEFEARLAALTAGSRQQPANTAGQLRGDRSATPLHEGKPGELLGGVEALRVSSVVRLLHLSSQDPAFFNGADATATTPLSAVEVHAVGGLGNWYLARCEWDSGDGGYLALVQLGEDGLHRAFHRWRLTGKATWASAFVARQTGFLNVEARTEDATGDGSYVLWEFDGATLREMLRVRSQATRAGCRVRGPGLERFWADVDGDGVADLTLFGVVQSTTVDRVLPALGEAAASPPTGGSYREFFVRRVFLSRKDSLGDVALVEAMTQREGDGPHGAPWMFETEAAPGGISVSR